jgi:hypothetical protein
VRLRQAEKIAANILWPFAWRLPTFKRALRIVSRQRRKRQMATARYAGRTFGFSIPISIDVAKEITRQNRLHRRRLRRMPFKRRATP